MKKIALTVVALAAMTTAAYAHHASHNEGNGHPPPAILSFGRMYGVDGPFLKEENSIRGIIGDEDPWEIRSAHGRLDIEGNLTIRVRGLVFGEGAPKNLVGKNDEEEFRATVSCLTEAGDEVHRAKVTTKGFPASESGDSDIDAHLKLPNPCVAPIVFILAGSENKWFAVTGFESEEGD